MPSDLIINKADITEHKFINAPLEDLKEGEVRLKLTSFGFTANNITYAATGHSFKYWQFFPTQEGWGKLPVWGFATISESKHSDLKKGERIYGYYPLATHLTIKASNINQHSFQDAAAHRQDLNPVYNTYVRTQNSPGFEQKHNNLNSILRPMFTTSFVLDDFLADNANFGASKLILSSASSKTAIGTAFLLNKHKQERPAYTIIGLSSEKNKAFVETLARYDQVLSYENATTLEPNQSAAYLDFAGNAKLRRDLHSHYQDNLKHSSMIGLAHWQEAGKREDLAGATPSIFFAPAQIQKRMKDWGKESYQQKLNAAWLAFLGMADNWLDIEEGQGQEAITKVYQAMLDGKANPRKGYVLAF